MDAAENRRPLKTRSQPWAQALAKFLAARKVQPNHISQAGVVFAALGGVAFLATKHSVFFLLAAAACIQLRLVCNLMDGLVAIEGGLKSKLGDLYNEIPDRVADTILLVCAGRAAGHPQLGWACAALAVFTAYLRVFGGSLGQKQDFCGPMAKQQRMFFLTLGCILAVTNAIIGPAMHALSISLWIIVIGSAATSMRRIGRIAKARLAAP